MSSEMIYRDYNMSDSALCMLTSNLCITLERDLADLGEFGITQVKIDALKALGDAFEVYPSDDVYLGYLMTAVEVKDAKMENVKEMVRDMALRFEMKWGTGTGVYKTLGIKGMNQFLEDKLLTSSRRVHDMATDNLLELADYGLTQIMLDDMAAENEAFEQAINDVRTKKMERDIKAKERIEKGNEIYKLVRDYCDMGKRVYMKSDPARYNDYIIYVTTYPTPSQIVGLAYDQGTGTLSWTADPDAEEYEAGFTPEQVGEEIWINFWTGSETSTIYDPGGPENYKFKVRGKNGPNYGPWSEVLLVVRV